MQCKYHVLKIQVRVAQARGYTLNATIANILKGESVRTQEVLLEAKMRLRVVPFPLEGNYLFP